MRPLSNPLQDGDLALNRFLIGRMLPAPFFVLKCHATIPFALDQRRSTEVIGGSEGYGRLFVLQLRKDVIRIHTMSVEYPMQVVLVKANAFQFQNGSFS